MDRCERCGREQDDVRPRDTGGMTNDLCYQCYSLIVGALIKVGATPRKLGKRQVA